MSIEEHLVSLRYLKQLKAAIDVLRDPKAPSYFSEKFKEATGINFVEYVARTRVEKARNLLQNPNLRISEIAFDVGFQSLSQFNRAFKAITGQSPREHRAGLLPAAS